MKKYKPFYSKVELLTMAFSCKNVGELCKVAKILKDLAADPRLDIDIDHFKKCAHNRLNQLYTK